MNSTTGHPAPSSAVAAVERWFGISARAARSRRTPIPSTRLPLPRPGQIVLIAGPSGSGKSTLLKRCRKHLPERLDLRRIPLRHAPVIDLFPGWPTRRALGLLSRVGLAEAHTYLLPPSRLSDGQRWRLRLALAVHRAAASPRPRSPCLVADEFAALLDPVTAAVVAHALRRIVTADSRLCALIASNRHDLCPNLRPDVLVMCDFGAWNAFPQPAEGPR